MAHLVAPGALPEARPRHERYVRITHWLATLAVFALLLSGTEITLSHPRFYWGETGNVNMPPAFTLPVPSSRRTVPTAYAFKLADQNGWSRYLHFQAAWLVLFTGLAYVVAAIRSGHLRRDLVPTRADRSWQALRSTIGQHLRLTPAAIGDGSSYNALQRLSYLATIFVLFPLVIWTGLSMSPAFVSVFPDTPAMFGGRQSARTLHFALTIALVLFIIVHVAMIALAGFRARVGAMIVASSEDGR